MQKVKFVRVSPAVSKKVLAVDGELARHGVRVGEAEVRYNTIKAVDVAKDAWVAYSIGKEALKQWPVIKDVLKNAGLTKQEIITLDLSKHIKKATKKQKKEDKQ